MNMRHDGWGELVNDDEHGGCLIPIMMLYHEHDEDREMRPPITPEKREQVIAGMAVGLLGAYKYFREQSGKPMLMCPSYVTPRNRGEAIPRSGATIHARAARGRSTKSAAVGRR